jgi:hypothetical protein
MSRKRSRRRIGHAVASRRAITVCTLFLDALRQSLIALTTCTIWPIWADAPRDSENAQWFSVRSLARRGFKNAINISRDHGPHSMVPFPTHFSVAARTLADRLSIWWCLACLDSGALTVSVSSTASASSSCNCNARPFHPTFAPQATVRRRLEATAPPASPTSPSVNRTIEEGSGTDSNRAAMTP